MTASSDDADGGGTDIGRAWDLTEPVPTVPVITDTPASPKAAARSLEASSASRQRRRKRPWTKVVVYSLVGFLVLGLAGAAGYIYQQTRTQLESTQSQLGSTRSQLHSTAAELTDTQGRLADSQAKLSTTIGKLDDTRARLDGALHRLKGVRGSLNNAEDRLDLQANQIETLKSCLNGVTDAMSYAAYSDYSSAIASLDAVQVSCNKAYSLF